MAKTSESDVWDQDPPGLQGSGRAKSTFMTRVPNMKQVAKARVVRDDWDDDDDEEELERDVEGENEKQGHARAKTMAPGPREAEEDTSNIWEEANKRLPMPELIVASASTSQSLPPPPPAALQPTLRILKRPSPRTSANDTGVISSTPLTSSSPAPTSGSASASGGTSPAPRGTFAEREAQYQEARSRIFGEKEKSGNASGQASSPSTSRTSPHSGGVVIVRDPLGPASEPELEPSGQDKAHDPGRPAKGFGERRRRK